MIFDTFALISSLATILLALLQWENGDNSSLYVKFVFDVLGVSLIFMILAFATGVYGVTAPLYRSLALTVLSICIGFLNTFIPWTFEEWQRTPETLVARRRI
jgi:hypothetical protein